jgi:hypothetical protein
MSVRSLTPSSRFDAISKAATAHNEETAKLRTAKESLEAAQVAAQKKQEMELERLRTQLVFKQLEMESSRKAVSRAPAPPSSQAPAPSQLPRWDVPSTPRRQRRPPAAQSPSPHRQKRPAPGSSKAQQHILLPGFVNDFAVPLAKKGKGVARAYASQNQGTRERDLEPPRLTQIDEHMELDRHYDDGQLAEVDFHMDFGEDFRAPQPQHLAGSSKIVKPFDWLGWVSFSLSACAQGSSTIWVDETTRPCAFDVTDCPKYNPTPAHPAIVRCEPRDNLLFGLYVPDGRGSRKRGQLRAHCTRRCRFTGTNNKHTPNWRSSGSRFSLPVHPSLKRHPS